MISPRQVSCIIPYAGAQVYPEARQHLFAAIESSVEQQFGEVVLSYDGPEPDPLAGYGQKDRVRILRHPQRIGPARARNAGIEAATTPYVVLLDQDDVLCPGYLKSMLSWMTEKEARCAAATLYYIGENQKRVGSIVSRHPDFFLPSGFCSEVSLIQEAGGFPDTFSEDLFFFQAVRKLVKLTTCPDARVLYRIHPSASAGNMLTAWALIKLLPEYHAGTFSLAEINTLARAYVAEGKIPPGLEARFGDSDFPMARFLARNAYASWLNRDLVNLLKYGSRLMFHVPKLAHMARYKWRHKRSA
jgi:glycosyltransferase involved in cell wall biosynthesis